MLQELEREPTVDELADEVEHDARTGCARSMRISQDPLSLDSPVGEEDDSNLVRLHRGPAAPRRPPRPPPARMLAEAVERGARRAQRARAGGRAAALRPRRRPGPHARRGRARSSASPASASARSSPRRWPSCATRTAARSSATTSTASRGCHTPPTRMVRWGTEGSSDQQNRARDLRALGWTYKEICEELGVSRSWVSLWGGRWRSTGPPGERRGRTSTATGPARRPHQPAPEGGGDRGPASSGAPSASGASPRGVPHRRSRVVRQERGARRDEVRFANSDPRMILFFSTGCANSSRSTSPG